MSAPSSPVPPPAPLGALLPDWRPPAPPAAEPAQGRYCRLEPLSPERHRAALWAAFRDAEPAAWDYMPYGPFADAAAHGAWLASVAGLADPMFFALIPEEGPSAGAAAGQASYLRVTPEHGVVEIGHIALAPLLRRGRAATEALHLMADAAFAAGYRRLEWKCNALNAASRQAATRLGFAFEGVFRQAQVVKGRNRDTAWFSIIDADWPRLRAAHRAWLSPENFDAEGRQKQALSALTAP